MPRAIRSWALAHPHEWGLIFGTPVPGYEAPEDTVEPYTRVAAAMVRPLVEARAAGRLRAGPRPARPVSDELRDAVAPVTDGLLPGMPVEKVVLAIEAWTTIVGVISLEVFGHWRNTILDPGAVLRGDAARRGGLDRAALTVGRRTAERPVAALPGSLGLAISRPPGVVLRRP